MWVKKPICGLIFPAFSSVPEFVLRVWIEVLNKKEEVTFSCRIVWDYFSLFHSGQIKSTPDRFDFFLEINFFIINSLFSFEQRRPTLFCPLSCDKKRKWAWFLFLNFEQKGDVVSNSVKVLYFTWPWKPEVIYLDYVFGPPHRWKKTLILLIEKNKTFT